ncbi:MAG: hypothetical protein K5895_09560 [Lachnospiraceae bacterium]|nr:hypothetical protein [Lachnospiraceae bacterium]
MSSISGLSGYYDYSSIYNNMSDITSKGITNNTLTDQVEATLEQTDFQSSNDEELMEACKSFESYLIEQVMKESKKMIKMNSDEEENDYMSTFGDNLLQQYAGIITEKGELGIAQKLFDSMKRNQGVTKL